MRIVINQQLAERNRKIATYTFLLTVVVLVGGFIFVNYSLFTGTTPEQLIVLLQVLVLPIAFVLTLFSVRFTNAWARRPFPEEAIEAGLKGLSKKSVIYHYYHAPARHVLIAPQGVFTIVTRWHQGRYSVQGSKWKTHSSPISRFLSLMRMDGIGDPTYDAIRAAQHTQKLLEPIAPDIQVQPIILFISSSAQIDLDNPDVPVLYADDKESPNLTGYLRELNRQTKEASNAPVKLPLSKEQIEQFEAKTVRA